HQFGREMLILIPVADVRADFGLRELADGAPQQLLLLGQPTVHERSEYHGAAELPARLVRCRAQRAVTAAIITRYRRRPLFCRNAMRAPSPDHAGIHAPFTPAAVCVRRRSSTRERRP